MPLLRGPEIDFPGRKLNIHGLRQRQLAASNMLKELLIGHLLRSACPGRRGAPPGNTYPMHPRLRSAPAVSIFVSISDFAIANEEIQRQVGNTRFYSVTVRAFKMPLEDRCEDYGQLARYLGTIPGHPHAFTLDDHHLFVTDKPMLVCGNTADMIGKSRYARHFNVSGDKLKHFGLFDCSTPRAGMTQGNAPLGACC